MSLQQAATPRQVLSTFCLSRQPVSYMGPQEPDLNRSNQLTPAGCVGQLNLPHISANLPSWRHFPPDRQGGVVGWA